MKGFILVVSEFKRCGVGCTQIVVHICNILSQWVMFLWQIHAASLFYHFSCLELNDLEYRDIGFVCELVCFNFAIILLYGDIIILCSAFIFGIDVTFGKCELPGDIKVVDLVTFTL